MSDYTGKQIGNYQLIKLLGSGGFADVYLGEHVHLRAQAAVKILHVQFSHKSFESFQQEARTIASLHHPHIIRVLDFGIAQDTIPYLVMDYAPGGTLRTRYPRGTRLPLEQVIMLVKQVASALQHAHERQIIHRDVKPENLLLGANDELLLSDFGLAVVERASSSFSRQNQAGTPLYMAPEQLRGKPRVASDQYALAVVTYEWLCGEPPFRGSVFEVWSQHLYAQPPGLCEKLPGLPSAIEEALFGALSKDPRDRFSRVQEFAEVLETIYRATVSGSPLSLPLPSSLPSTAPLAEVSVGHFSLPGEVTVDMEQVCASPTMPLRPVTVAPAQHLNRSRLLAKVRAFWIDGVLERSLSRQAPIALRLQECPEALANPWHLVTPEPGQQPFAPSQEIRIAEWYDKAGGELLILGTPGAGKTILLLQLTRDLLERAEMDAAHPLPVIFHLSSWAQQRQPLVSWLIEELREKYQVPLHLARTWVETDQILPLLDGLDEVLPTHRAACIDAINLYRQEHGLLPMVLCSRSADYFALGKRLVLQKAVVVQSLALEQIDRFLARAGARFEHIRLALWNDPTLRELITTPLMLSILMQSYQDMPIHDLLREQTHETQKRRLLATYVKRALAYRRGTSVAPPQHAMHHLSWLAQQLKRRSQTVFYLEQLQPDWLNGEWSTLLYRFLAINLPAIIVGILLSFVVPSVLFAGASPFIGTVYAPLGGFLGLLFSEILFTQQRSERTRHFGGNRWLFHNRMHSLYQGGIISLGIMMVGLWEGQEQGLVAGLNYGLSSLLAYLLLRQSQKSSSRTIHAIIPGGHWWRRLLTSKHLRAGCLVGLSYGLSAGLVLGISSMSLFRQSYTTPDYGQHYGLYYGLFSGAFSGVLDEGLRIGAIGGLLSALLAGINEHIHPAERIVWSWASLRRSLFTRRHASGGLRVLVVISGITAISGWTANGLSEWLSGWLSHANESVQSASSQSLSSNLVAWLEYGLIAGLSVGFSYWLILGLFQGVSSTTIDDRHRSRPNQGIQQSGRNGLTFGLVGGALCGLICCLALLLNTELNTVLNWPSPLFAHCNPPVSVWQEIAYLLGVSHSTVGTSSCVTAIPAVEPSYSFAQQLSFVLSIHLGEGLGIGLVNGVVIGFACGLLIALLKGLLAWLQHGVLRILLWQQRAIPWHVTDLLDTMAERVLLQKVGGGYMFIHRLLLDHFASQEGGPGSDTASEQPEFSPPS